MSKEILNNEEKKKLLEIARKTIEEYINSNRIPRFEIIDPKLKTKNGVFVSLHKKGELRGCIGNFTSNKPLYEMVQEMAIASSTHDPRFPPVTADELIDLEIEISVLSPLEEVKDLSKIKVGTHGIYITKGLNRGVLLPQVATEYGWDRDTFLEHTCMKAGLSPNAWRKERLKIEIFSADIFSESSILR